MYHPTEAVLSVIPGTTEHDRLVVVLRQQFGEGSRLEIRQQSWADGIGWFTQSSVAIDPQQAEFIRSALGGQGKSKRAFSLAKSPQIARHGVVAAESA